MKQDEIAWKTSDWIIQEIGLAIGKQLDLILLVEIGLREPGGLQGNIEYIPFDRTHPELAFPKILEMISALLPRVAPPAEITAHPATPTAKAEQPEPETFEDVFKTPRPDWTRVHYQIGFMSALADGDREGADKIEAAYLATEDATQPNNRATWKAFAEYRRIVSGAGGALSTLEATAAENQNSSEIAEYLAWTYRYYGDESKAANAYELAAKHAIGDSEKVRLMGQAAATYIRVGQEATADKILRELRRVVATTGAGELELLKAILRVAEIKNEAETELALLERINEIDPSDVKSRFSLAYKHGELGNNDLCFYHYSKIPDRERDRTTWNNIGVVRDQLSMAIKSVDAYRKSEEMSETLAMSNLAIKFLSGGFIVEAQQECDKALAIKDYHKNIASTLARLKVAPEAEDQTERETLEEATPKSEFYRGFGRAACRPHPESFGGQWAGPDCELQIRIMNDQFEATGRYERPVSPLAIAFSSPFHALAKPEPYRVTYHGTIRGRAILAHVTRAREGEPPQQTSLLGSVGGQEPKVLMLIADDETEIRAMEVSQSGKPRFYSLAPVRERQPSS